MPVRGLVTYKGAAAPGVTVQFHTTGEPQGMAEIYAAKPSAVTDVEGKFALSTYEEGDGVAAGEYVVTFEWKDFDPLKNGYSGPDRLKGKYADPKTSEFRVTIRSDEEQVIDLKTFDLME